VKVVGSSSAAEEKLSTLASNGFGHSMAFFFKVKFHHPKSNKTKHVNSRR
jgi:hypothetical protein